MRKRFLVSALMLCIAALSIAQSVYEDDLALVYYMPQTQLAITVEYDEIHTQPGPFYLYAERYLGAHTVVTEAQTRYQIRTIAVAPVTIADHQRSYKVDATSLLPYLSLTPDGLLYGYNVGVYPAEEISPVVAHQPTTPATPLMPLMEEQFVASSTAKMAEGAAKQIYHIRETRMNILGGDVEHLPADGTSMQLVLDELDKREAALVALFVGTTNVQQHTHTYHITPAKDVTKQVIGRFSQYDGIVAADNLSGEPIYLTIKGHRQALLPMQVEATTKKKTVVSSPLYYNLPGSADIQLDWAGTTITQVTYPVAQYGIAIPLANSLFTSKKLPAIYFNIATGNILSIQP